MLDNEDLKKNREQDKYFNVKYALAIYNFVLPSSEKFIKEARDFLERKKRTQNGTRL